MGHTALHYSKTISSYIPITNHKSSKKKRYAFFSLYINRINAPVNNACVSRYNMNNINIARDQMKSLIDSVS